MNDVKIRKALRYLDYHDYSGLSSITTKCLVLEKNDFQLSSMFFTDLPVDMLCFKETVYILYMDWFVFILMILIRMFLLYFYILLISLGEGCDPSFDKKSEFFLPLNVLSNIMEKWLQRKWILKVYRQKIVRWPTCKTIYTYHAFFPFFFFFFCLNSHIFLHCMSWIFTFSPIIIRIL